MYGSGIFLGLMVLIFFIVGSICGIVALSKIQRLVRDLENVRNQLRSLRDDPKKVIPIPRSHCESLWRSVVKLLNCLTGIESRSGDTATI